MKVNERDINLIDSPRHSPHAKGKKLENSKIFIFYSIFCFTFVSLVKWNLTSLYNIVFI